MVMMMTMMMLFTQNNFKLDFMTQAIYCIIHIFLCFLFILLLFSYIIFKQTGYRKILTQGYRI